MNLGTIPIKIIEIQCFNFYIYSLFIKLKFSLKINLKICICIYILVTRNFIKTYCIYTN